MTRIRNRSAAGAMIGAEQTCVPLHGQPGDWLSAQI
jgi:hypothetical protein